MPIELHGKVIERKDKVRVDCLGPAGCPVCAGELEDILKEKPDNPLPTDRDGLQWLGRFTEKLNYDLWCETNGYHVIARFGAGDNFMISSAFLSSLVHPALNEAGRRAKEFGVW